LVVTGACLVVVATKWPTSGLTIAPQSELPVGWRFYTPDNSRLPAGRVKRIEQDRVGVTWVRSEGGPPTYADPATRIPRDPSDLGEWQVYDSLDQAVEAAYESIVAGGDVPGFWTVDDQASVWRPAGYYDGRRWHSMSALRPRGEAAANPPMFDVDGFGHLHLRSRWVAGPYEQDLLIRFDAEGERAGVWPLGGQEGIRTGPLRAGDGQVWLIHGTGGLCASCGPQGIEVPLPAGHTTRGIAGDTQPVVDLDGFIRVPLLGPLVAPGQRPWGWATLTERPYRWRLHWLEAEGGLSLGETAWDLLRGRALMAASGLLMFDTDGSLLGRFDLAAPGWPLGSPSALHYDLEYRIWFGTPDGLAVGPAASLGPGFAPPPKARPAYLPHARWR
jgi:hypothetical protein